MRSVLIRSRPIASKDVFNFYLKFSKNDLSTSIFDRVKNAIGKYTGRKPTLASAQSLFYNAYAQADNSNWQSKGLVGSDFRSKQTLLTLHIWMIHKRLLLEEKQGGLLVQEAMFDELWEDTSKRIRTHKINELSLNKYLKGVQGYSFRTCLELDEAMTKAPNETEVIEQIGGVVWRMAYLRRDEIDPELVMKFANYIRKEQLSLLEIPTKAIFEGRIKWGPLPFEEGRTSYSKRSAVSTDATADITVDDALQEHADNASNLGEGSVWREATSEDGRLYYWNTETRESRWEIPSE
jgi:cytochrome b pre-mRNA-processing protein 3